MPGNCGDLYISNYAYEPYAKFGKKVLRVQSYNADCGENGIYQVTNSLPKGQYAFSTYLRVLSAFSGTDAGAFIRVTDTSGNVLGVSEHLVKTDSEYDHGDKNHPHAWICDADVIVHLLGDDILSMLFFRKIWLFMLYLAEN